MPYSEPVLIVPVIFGIALALQPVDVINIFFGTAFTKAVGHLGISGYFYPALMFKGDLSAAFFAFENAVHALKDFLNRQNLALSDYFSFFFFGMLQFFIKLDYFRHGNPF
jgi:hypothetical protein